MDTWDDPWIREIYLCFAPQTGKTQVAYNCVAASVARDWGPIFYVMPDEKVTKRMARRRIRPMFRLSPSLAELLSARVDDTTTLHIQFINGVDLMMAWATSAAELSSESAPVIVLDELDKFPPFAGREAAPVSLARIRANAYPLTYKLLGLSTPATEDKYIGTALEQECDEVRRYQAVCPVCGTAQVMEFERIVWPSACRDPREIVRRRLAAYECVRCSMSWDDRLRDHAVKAGLALPGHGWTASTPPGEPAKAVAPVERPRVVGFHLPSWYSPFVSLSAVAAAFLKGKDDPGKQMVFVTQHKAETFRAVVAPKEESKVLERRVPDLPPGVVPPAAVAVTCGIDVQKYTFWFVVRAWAEDHTSWLIQYGELATWEDVEALVFRTRYPVAGTDETMGIWRAALDTGGGKTDDDWTRTEEIYEWLRANGRGIAYGTKGASRQQLKRVRLSVMDTFPHSRKPIPGGLELYLIDSDAFKGIIHWRLERGARSSIPTAGRSARRRSPSASTSTPRRGRITRSSSSPRSSSGPAGQAVLEGGPEGEPPPRRRVPSCRRGPRRLAAVPEDDRGVPAAGAGGRRRGRPATPPPAHRRHPAGAGPGRAMVMKNN
jgi:phage terminase large subunit GpA-like protein